MALKTTDSFDSLQLGNEITLTGEIFTSRDKAIQKAIGGDTPYETDQIIFHCGPMVKKNGDWEVVAAGPTTSSRMNDYTPEFIRKYKPKAIIGKGGMNQKCYDEMKKVGCIYLLFTGGCGALAADGIKKVIDVQYLELGMPEAVWHFEVDNFGPLIVAAKDGKTILK